MNTPVSGESWPKYGKPAPHRWKPTGSRFGARLRAARVAREWTQLELGARCGFAQQVIGTLERGDHDPSVGTLQKIAVALGVSMDDLWGIDDDDVVKRMPVATSDLRIIDEEIEKVISLATTLQRRVQALMLRESIRTSEWEEQELDTDIVEA